MRRPGREPYSQPHGRQGQVDENDVVPSLHLGKAIEPMRKPKRSHRPQAARYAR